MRSNTVLRVMGIPGRPQRSGTVAGGSRNGRLQADSMECLHEGVSVKYRITTLIERCRHIAGLQDCRLSALSQTARFY
jgi:hypothetical protein